MVRHTSTWRHSSCCLLLPSGTKLLTLCFCSLPRFLPVYLMSPQCRKKDIKQYKQNYWQDIKCQNGIRTLAFRTICCSSHQSNANIPKCPYNYCSTQGHAIDTGACTINTRVSVMAWGNAQDSDVTFAEASLNLIRPTWPISSTTWIILNSDLGRLTRKKLL